MNNNRLKQRFSKLEKALKKLDRGLQIFDYKAFLEKRESLRAGNNHDEDEHILLELEELDLEREGIIQRFEYTFELFILK